VLSYNLAQALSKAANLVMGLAALLFVLISLQGSIFSSAARKVLLLRVVKVEYPYIVCVGEWGP
jgi:hypothetical protein